MEQPSMLGNVNHNAGYVKEEDQNWSTAQRAVSEAAGGGEQAEADDRSTPPTRRAAASPRPRLAAEMVPKEDTQEVGGATISQASHDRASSAREEVDDSRDLRNNLNQMNQEIHALQQKLDAQLNREEIGEVEDLIEDLKGQIEKEQQHLHQLRGGRGSSEMVRASKEIQNIELSEGQESLQKEDNIEQSSELKEELMGLHSELSHRRRRRESQGTDLTKMSLAEARNSGQVLSPKDFRSFEEQIANQDQNFNPAMQETRSGQTKLAKRDSSAYTESMMAYQDPMGQYGGCTLTTNNGTFPQRTGSPRERADGRRVVQARRSSNYWNHKQYAETNESLDSVDFNRLNKDTIGKQEVAIYGQSFKINLKRRGRGNKDIAVEQTKQITNRENRSPGTAMMSQYQTDESQNNSNLNILKQQHIPQYTSSSGFKANRKQHQGSQAGDRTKPATAPQQPLLKADHQRLKLKWNLKTQQPQQQNLKHSRFLNRPMNVLMPTQYQPQVDVMLNQNAVLMSKRAQEINKTVYLKNRFHHVDFNVVQAPGQPSRPRTIEESGRRETAAAAATSMRAAVGEPTGAGNQSPLTHLLQNQAEKYDDEVKNEMNKIRIKAAGLTRSVEGRLPKLRTAGQGGENSTGAAAVTVKIMRGSDEADDRLISSDANSTSRQQVRASPNLTFHHTSRQEQYKIALDGAKPVSSLISQHSLPPEAEAALRSSAGCKTTQSELKTVFTHKFERNATDRSKWPQEQQNTEQLKNRKKSQNVEEDAPDTKGSKSTPDRDRTAVLNPSARVKRVPLAQQRKEGQHHEKINVQESEFIERSQQLASPTHHKAPETKGSQRNRSVKQPTLPNGEPSTKSRPKESTILPDLAMASTMAAIAIDKRAALHLCVRGSSKAKQPEAPPKLIPVSKQPMDLYATGLSTEAVGPHAYQYQHKALFQNSFFNSQFEKILLQNMMKGLAKPFALSPVDGAQRARPSLHERLEEPYGTQTFETSAAVSKENSSEEVRAAQILGDMQGSGSLYEVLHDGTFVRDVGEPHAMTRRSRVEQRRLVALDPTDRQELLAGGDEILPQPLAFVEQNDQVLTKKHNQYYKQLRSLQKDGQEIVISHPYDLSHLVNAEKSFLTTMNLAKNRKELIEKKKLQIRSFEPNSSRQLGAGPPKATPQLASTTPKRAKELWLRRAQESTQQGLQIHQDKHQGRLRTIQARARAQQYNLKTGKATLFEKSKSTIRKDHGGRRDASAEVPSARQTPRCKDMTQNQHLRARNSPKLDDEPLRTGCYEKRDFINIHSQKPLNRPRAFNTTTARSPRLQNAHDGHEARQNEAMLADEHNGAADEAMKKDFSDDASRAEGKQSHFEQLHDYISERSKEHEASTNFRLPESNQNSQSPRSRPKKKSKVVVQDVLGYQMKQTTHPSSKFDDGGEILERKETAGLPMKQKTHQPSERSAQNEQQPSHNAAEQAAQGRQVAYSSFGSPGKKAAQGHSTEQVPTPGRAQNLQDEAPPAIRACISGAGCIESLNELNSSPKDLTRSHREGHQQSLTLVSDHMSSAVAKSKRESFEDQANGAAKEMRSKIQHGHDAGPSAHVLISRETFDKREQTDVDKAQAQDCALESKCTLGMYNPIYHKVNIAHQKPAATKQEKRVAVTNFLHINQVVLQSREDGSQSPKRSMAGRRQVKGYAGGVIGSGVDASVYMGFTSPKNNSSQEKRRPKTKGTFTRGIRDDQILVQNFQPPGMPNKSSEQNRLAANHQNGNIQSNEKGHAKPGMTLDLRGPDQRDNLLGWPPHRWPQEQTERTSLSPATSQDCYAMPPVQIKARGAKVANLQAAVLQKVPKTQATQLLGSDPFTMPGAHGKLAPLDLAECCLTSAPAYQNTPEKHPSTVQSRRNMNSVGTDNFSALESFKPLNTKEIRLHCQQTHKTAQENEKKRLGSQQSVQRRSPPPNFAHTKTIKVSKIAAQKRHLQVQENDDLAEVLTEKPLDAYTVQILRQRTLYKMQRGLWLQYEHEWNRFKQSDHLRAQAPIPPNCKILPLHIYLTNAKLSLKDLKAVPPTQEALRSSGTSNTQRAARSPTPETSARDPEPFPSGQPCWNQRPQALAGASVDSLTGPSLSFQQAAVIDARTFEDCYKEAKRRLLMCSMRIIDEQALTQMKGELLEGYQQIMVSVAEAAAGWAAGAKDHAGLDDAAARRLTLLGENGFIVEYSEQQSALQEQSRARQKEERATRLANTRPSSQRPSPRPAAGAAPGRHPRAGREDENQQAVDGQERGGALGADAVGQEDHTTITGVHTLLADISERRQLSGSADDSRSQTHIRKERYFKE